MNLFKSEQIYVSIQKTKVWNCIRGDHEAKIVTFITERRIFTLRLFKIEQLFPLCNNPLYDGEYASNKSVKTFASEEKCKAKIWLHQYNEQRKKVF